MDAMIQVAVHRHARVVAGGSAKAHIAATPNLVPVLLPATSQASMTQKVDCVATPPGCPQT